MDVGEKRKAYDVSVWRLGVWNLDTSWSSKAEAEAEVEFMTKNHFVVRMTERDAVEEEV
jgi:hypothetical protein